jgi:hypothetical protein
MQSEACQWRSRTLRDPNYLLSMWHGDDGPIQTYAGQAGALPRLLPEAGQKRTSPTRRPNGTALKLTGGSSVIP